MILFIWKLTESMLASPVLPTGALTYVFPSCSGWESKGGKTLRCIWGWVGGVWQLVVGVLRGNTIRGNTTRNSERTMALWEGLWEGLCKTSENL